MFFLLINLIKSTGFLESQQQVVNDVWNEKSFLAQWAGRESWQCPVNTAAACSSIWTPRHPRTQTVPVPAVTSEGISDGPSITSPYQGFLSPSHTALRSWRRCGRKRLSIWAEGLLAGNRMAWILSKPLGPSGVWGFALRLHASGLLA